MKKGRHRRYEEARALKRSRGEDSIEDLMDRLDDDPFALPRTPEADLATDDTDSDEYDDYEGYTDS